jgi:hypothetical protein
VLIGELVRRLTDLVESFGFESRFGRTDIKEDVQKENPNGEALAHEVEECRVFPG